MESDKEEQMVFLDRTTRATRGKRMTKLLDDEVEEDEQFWNQEALKEEEHDDNYEAEAEVADEFDSDFNDDEPEPDAVAENEKELRDLPKKRLIYPGKSAPKKKKKKKLVSKLEDAPEDEKPVEEELGDKEQDDKGQNEEDMEGEKVIRKSTRTSVIVRQAERDALRAAIQATTKPIQRKKVGEEKRMTQEEMLLEAAQTEIMNLRNLERVLAREEEVKKKAIVHKEVYKGPQVRYLSKDGCNYLEFCNGASFNSEISTKSIPYPEKAVCVITGLPAKYRDPKTGLPYATRDAFKEIRERFMDQHNGLRKKMEMGDLFDTLVSKGFAVRQKRTMIPKKDRSFSLRNPARFFMFNSPEESEEDSDSD
uniref:SWR1 complex subunit 2 n=1 Tax=Noccaea caerulescens TaxID=107243 RepID=A0A1J3ILG3_NOCCA